MRPGRKGTRRRLTDGDKLQVVLLSPVNDPGGEDVDGGVVGLVHERDVAVAPGAGLDEGLLALLGRLVVPVARVDVVGDDLVAHLSEHGQDLAARLEVGWAHIRRLLADQVNEGVLEPGHLLLDLRRAIAGPVGVGP